jgi:hypothetical protein
MRRFECFAYPFRKGLLLLSRSCREPHTYQKAYVLTAALFRNHFDVINVLKECKAAELFGTTRASNTTESTQGTACAQLGLEGQMNP